MGDMTLLDLVHHHLSGKPPAYAEAIKILKGVPWDSEECKSGAINIFFELSKEKYSEIIEGFFEELLEVYFHPSIEPLDSLWKSHEEMMITYAMRFHRWLFLAAKFRRSLEIAVRFKNEKCIRNVYYNALHRDDLDIAEEAQAHLKVMQRRRAVKHSYSFSSTSHSSSCSTCSLSDGSSDVSGDELVFPNQKSTSTLPLKDKDLSSTPQSFNMTGQDPITSPETSKAISKRWSGKGEALASGITIVRLGDV